MTKRDHILQLAERGLPGPHTPAAFFLHFPPECHTGRAAIEKHIEFFRATGSDILKIQYEKNYPSIPGIRRPADWAKIPCYEREFYSEPVQVVRGLVNEMKSEAVVIVTLYSAFMFAGQMAGEDLLVQHLEEDPETVEKGLSIITESMLTFIRGCLDAGVDGFYASTQGREAGRFSDPAIFDQFVRPLEMRVWEEIDAKAALNVLHVCDYVAPYDSLEPFADYPGQIVNAPLELTSGRLTARDVAALFGRPFLGGMERLGPLSTGPRDAVVSEARDALRDAPPGMILGADCTLAADADWENIAAAVETAHATAPATRHGRP